LEGWKENADTRLSGAGDDHGSFDAGRSGLVNVH